MLALEPSRHQQSYFQHQPMDNQTMHDPFAPLNLESCGSFGSHPLFAQAPHSFFDTTPSFMVEAPQEMNKQAFYPSASPSMSTTRSTEHPASTLSTASGPSLTSASSSAVGSPYSKATHGVAYQENWAPVTDALPQDFVASGMDPDMVFAQGKLPDTFVGEFQTIPSSLKPENGPVFSPVSPTVESFPMSPMSFNSPMEYLGQNKTIDSILAGAHAPTTPSPGATPAMSYHSEFSSPKTLHRGDSSPRVFKSPVTPSSAFSGNISMRSPSVPSRRRSRTYPAPVSGVKQEHDSFFKPKKLSSRSVSSHFDFAEQPHAGPFQDSFFRQSSGNFVLPLESSCWFFLADTPCSHCSSFFFIMIPDLSNLNFFSRTYSESNGKI